MNNIILTLFVFLELYLLTSDVPPNIKLYKNIFLWTFPSLVIYFMIRPILKNFNIKVEKNN